MQGQRAAITKDILEETSPFVAFSIWKQNVVMLETAIHDARLTAVSERERRHKRRFQIQQEVRYKMLYGQRLAEVGAGRTKNISSGGLWFSTETMLVSGAPI